VLYGKDISKYEEHTKRVWSIDFAFADPTRFASASDDAKVKIWSTTQPHSVATIEGKANMCCVQFNPESAFEVVAGSAGKPDR
jgi:E3 ubiquitin-protein ligase RFWD2